MTDQISTAAKAVFMRLPHPHCIAIYLEFVAQETTLIPCTAAGAMSFQSEDETRTLSIKAGQRFYLARSESCPNWFYVISLVTRRGESAWRCACPAHKPCKHERNAQPVIAAHAQADAERVRAFEEAYTREALEAEAARKAASFDFQYDDASASELESMAFAESCRGNMKRATSLRAQAAAKRQNAPLNGREIRRENGIIMR